MTRSLALVSLALCALLAATSARADDPPAPSPPAPPASAPETTPPASDVPPTDAPPPSSQGTSDPAEEHAPAALQGEAPPPPAPATPPSSTSANASTNASVPANATPAAQVTTKHERRVGDPVPLTQREPTVNALGFMLGVRYGLVGTGPTRFTDDIRFGLTDSIELRTDLVPYPSSLMLRARFGSPNDAWGAPMIDVGLAHWDAGIRIVPDTGESAVGMRFHFEGGVAYAKTLNDKTEVWGQAHYRYRLSLLKNDDEHAVEAAAHIGYDLIDSLNVSAGLGFATTIGTPVRELSIVFVETDAPGVSHLLARDEGSTYEVTVPLTMTYGRVENFDVDLFCTPRVYPTFGILFGAGVRLRLDPFKS